ncbi:MAG: hypothetical protein ACK4NC_07435 [Candidatus Gracilibacteria bacterium]
MLSKGLQVLRTLGIVLAEYETSNKYLELIFADRRLKVRIRIETEIIGKDKKIFHVDQWLELCSGILQGVVKVEKYGIKIGDVILPAIPAIGYSCGIVEDVAGVVNGKVLKNHLDACLSLKGVEWIDVRIDQVLTLSCKGIDSDICLSADCLFSKRLEGRISWNIAKALIEWLDDQPVVIGRDGKGLTWNCGDMLIWSY